MIIIITGAESIRRKVLVLGRFVRILNIIRDNFEGLQELKRLAPSERAPFNCLINGSTGVAHGELLSIIFLEIVSKKFRDSEKSMQK